MRRLAASSLGEHTSLRRGAGMTLIEVLVALALLAMLAAGMLSAFRTAQRTYAAVIRMDRSSTEIVGAQRFLRSTLESVRPAMPGQSGEQGLRGSENTLTYSAPAPLGSGADGHHRFRVFTTSRTDGLHDLVVESRLDRGTTATSTAGDPAAAGEGWSSSEETLIRRIAGIDLSYREATDSRWLDQWSGIGVPALVRLRVRFPAGDPRIWPDLIVDPRITDAASCDFDVVAQTCRQTP